MASREADGVGRAWTMRAAIAALGAVLAAWAMPAVAQSGATASLELAARSLRPGQYLWRDSDPAAGPVAVIVSVPLQTAFVYRGEALIGVASVSTGMRGKPTPIGEFTILQKRVFHRSNLYSNAPMPHMQRLTWDGIALHAGHNPGYPASHGCIRLPPAFAMLLYGATALGAAVAVVDDVDVAPPPRDAFPVLIADASAFDAARFALVTWRAGGPAIAPRSLRVDGDEWLVPDARLLPPVRRG